MYRFYIIRINVFFLLLFKISVCAESQTVTYRIFFKDKGKENFIKGSAIYESTLKSLSERALERRRKILTEENLINIQDAQLNQEYLNLIEAAGAEIIAKIKWENYCVAIIKSNEILEKIKDFEFVSLIQPTSSEFKVLTGKASGTIFNTQKSTILNIISNSLTDSSGVEYGFSSEFSNMIHIPEVHNLGISGEGVLMGFLDSGFRPKAVRALDNLKLFSQYDFIFNDSITSNENFDHPHQDLHGTQVLTVAVGNEPEKYIGVAPFAEVALAKTENLQFERKIEEDLYFEGVEWLESLGVDIISASLGYFNFDSTETPYSYSDLNGRKPITSKAVNYAAERGVLFFAAAGNNGPNENTLNTPSDADSVISVGSVGADRTVSKFSSRGTDGAGRIRPHIAAMGGNVFVITLNDSIPYGINSGTSLSAPMIAGSAALILSAFPEMKPFDVKKLLFENSDKYPEQNNGTGYGIPDIYKAITEHDIVISPLMTFPTMNYQRLIFKIKYKEPILVANVYLKFPGTEIYEEIPLRYFSKDYYYTDINKNIFKDGEASGYVLAKSNTKSRRMPYNPESYFKIKINEEKIPFALQKQDFPPQYIENAGSFVYPSVVDRFRSNISLVTYSNDKLPLTVLVTDMLGKEIYKEIFSNSYAGLIERNISTSHLISGIYLIHLISANRNETLKFIII